MKLKIMMMMHVVVVHAWCVKSKLEPWEQMNIVAFCFHCDEHVRMWDGWREHFALLLLPHRCSGLTNRKQVTSLVVCVAEQNQQGLECRLRDLVCATFGLVLIDCGVCGFP